VVNGGGFGAVRDNLNVRCGKESRKEVFLDVPDDSDGLEKLS